MVATPENTHCIIGAREQSVATDKKVRRDHGYRTGIPVRYDCPGH